jgi:hypothetical protein
MLKKILNFLTSKGFEFNFQKFKEKRRIKKENYIRTHLSEKGRFIYDALKDKKSVWMINHWELWLETRNPYENPYWVYRSRHPENDAPIILWTCNGKWAFHDRYKNFKFTNYDKRILWPMAIRKREEVIEEDKLDMLAASLKGQDLIFAQKNKIDPIRSSRGW